MSARDVPLRMLEIVEKYELAGETQVMESVHHLPIRLLFRFRRGWLPKLLGINLNVRLHFGELDGCLTIRPR